MSAKGISLQASRNSTCLYVLFLLIFVFGCANARAHDALTSGVWLDIGSKHVFLETVVPVNQLALALPEFSEKVTVLREADRELLKEYFIEHVGLLGKDEKRFPGKVLALSLADQEGQRFLSVQMAFYLSDSSDSEGLLLLDDAVLHRVVSHKTFVLIRSDFRRGMVSGDVTQIGVIRYRHNSLPLVEASGDRWQGFVAMLMLGAEHFWEGTDHLLFLLGILLLTPVSAWQRRARRKVAAKTLLLSITAFTLGHSISLAAASLGILVIPARPIEVLVALSILVVFVQVLRGVGGRHRGVWLAGGFGLIHGLAFAGVLMDMKLVGADLAVALLGFNLGLECLQLLVIGLLIPCFYLLGDSRFGSWVVRGVSVYAMILAGGWVVGRWLAIPSPVAGLDSLLTEHKLAIFLGFAVLCLLQGMRRSRGHRASSIATYTID